MSYGPVLMLCAGVALLSSCKPPSSKSLTFADWCKGAAPAGGGQYVTFQDTHELETMNTCDGKTLKFFPLMDGNGDGTVDPMEIARSAGAGYTEAMRDKRCPWLYTGVTSAPPARPRTFVLRDGPGADELQLSPAESFMYQSSNARKQHSVGPSQSCTFKKAVTP